MTTLTAAPLHNIAVVNNIAVAPATKPAMYQTFVDAVTKAGGTIVDDLAQASALMWADPSAPDLYPETIAAAPNVKWVQLPYAGIEPFLDHLDHDRIWTCGKGTYAEPVAEWIIAALLTGLRDFYLFTQSKTWAAQTGRNLLGANLTVLGGGGITQALMRLLEPWNTQVTVVRLSAEPFPGATRTVTQDDLLSAVSNADAVVVALSLTPETHHIINADVLSAMPNTAWLVNVGRGGHVNHVALEDALRNGDIAGAVLDVTDPEPLPDSSELWQFDNCIITPHIGNTPEMGLPLIASRVEENVRRWLAGDPLVGLVDVTAGY